MLLFSGQSVLRLLVVALLVIGSAIVGPTLRADLITHLSFDETLEDVGPGANDGEFFGDIEPIYVEGHDGNPTGAVSFDGIDDYVLLTPNSGLPLTHSPAFSVLLWVNASVTPDDRVFSESSSTSATPLFNIGTHNTALDGTVDSYIRSAANVQINIHEHSTGVAFDNTWHHIAWVDDGGIVTLYVDGIADGNDFSYARPTEAMSITTIGGIWRPTGATPVCCILTGAIDDVRLYDHAVTQAEVIGAIGGDLCPVAGDPNFEDTTCGSLLVSGPPGNQPGVYTLTVTGAVDGTGDPISYYFRAESGAGAVVQAGPLAENIAPLTLGVGSWTITARVDDDGFCADEAAAATCTQVVDVTCPTDGDTTCTGVTVSGPAGNTPGNYTIQTVGAADGNGDTILYTFRAENSAAGLSFATAALLGESSAFFSLSAGTWTMSVTVDDNLVCGDVGPSVTCSTQIVVGASAPALVSRWTIAGSLEDAQPAGNHGTFFGDLAPLYADGYDDAPNGAIALDGVDDYVNVTQNSGLPITANTAYSVALWVRGLPQTDRRVFSEAYAAAGAVPAPVRNINPLFNIGTHNGGLNGAVDIYIRTDQGQVLVDHRQTVREAFDDTWHHVAWVDDNGKARVYIDGVRDETDFSYTPGSVSVDTTSIGSIVRAAPGNWFLGELDDVRVYNYAITESEILALVPERPGCPVDADVACSGILVNAPSNNYPGLFQVSSPDATDTSGDPIIYTFTATHPDGDHLQRGPADLNAVEFLIRKAGAWTFTVKVDDDVLCRDDAPNATCSTVLNVVAPPPELVTHYKLDGDLIDYGVAGNDGIFSNFQEPVYVEDHLGNAGTALSFDGVDDYLEAQITQELPISTNLSIVAYTMAMWVRGLPQPDRRVYSEGSTADNNPLLTLGTQAAGTTGQVDVFIRPGPGHRLSQSIAFDGEWHHLAWVDSEGTAALYIDGVLDATNFDYAKPAMVLDKVSLGGVLRAAACCYFTGAIDDARIYNYALGAEEIQELVVGEIDERPQFHRGDVDSNAKLELTDAVRILGYLFLGNAAPVCFESADADNNGVLQLTDAVRILGYLFLGQAPPAPPGPPPADCGTDTDEAGSPADIGCEVYTGC